MKHAVASLLALGALVSCSSSDSHGTAASGGAAGSAEVTASGGTKASGGTTASGGITASGATRSASGGVSGAGAGGATAASGGGNAAGGKSAGGSPAAGCADAGDAPACSACAAYGATPTKLGSTPSGLANLSGAAFSWKTPGVLYANNDGGTGEFYALSTDGTVRDRFVFSTSSAVDIEDMGVGPCPDGTCVYLADIGGNRSSRTVYDILRAAEPSVGDTPPSSATSLKYERFSFSYDDHAVHNAESLVVEPKTGALYVITKVDAGKPSAVYKLPQPPDATAMNTATHLVDLTVPTAMNREATSASAHPCGLGFLLRTYDMLYEFRIPAGAPFEDAFRATPTVVPSSTETQSEAVAYRSDGSGYVTSGEGSGAPIYGVSCR
jgi:hypothetical protein